MRFKIVIPVYNAIRYIETCINSLKSQEYQEFDVIIIDDCSTDGTWELLNKICTYRKVRNDTRIGSGLANIVKGIRLSDASPEDVIVTLDGDDYLVFVNCLSHLKTFYNNNVWMTYGQYFPLSGIYRDFCRPVTDSFNYRKSGDWHTSHLRTFRRWLWDSIKDSDLRDNEGNYFKVAWDRAFMYPLIEMAGSHAFFIPKVMYMYNDLNPASDMYLEPVYGEEMAQYIINKPCYNRL